MSSKWTAVAAALALAGIAASGPSQSAEKVLRVGMTAADVPLTTGQPSQGGEGLRFMGVTVYDGLVNWDLSCFDMAAVLKPGLAESWSVSETDNTTWTFKLRRGVKFHDGSEFNADAVVWNFDKLMKRDAPQFDQAQSIQGEEPRYLQCGRRGDQQGVLWIDERAARRLPEVLGALCRPDPDVRVEEKIHDGPSVPVVREVRSDDVPTPR